MTSSCSVLALASLSAIISAAMPSTFQETLQLHASFGMALSTAVMSLELNSLQHHVPGAYIYIHIYIYTCLSVCI